MGTSTATVTLSLMEHEPLQGLVPELVVPDSL
jgi:hypothetical protein